MSSCSHAGLSERGPLSIEKRFPITACRFVLCLATALAASQVRAEVQITVDTWQDVVNPGDSKTSLREAINSANGGADDYRIVCNAAIMPCAMNGHGDDDNATGDFDINTPGRQVTIVALIDAVSVSGGGNDRIFHIHSGSRVVIGGMLLYGGLATDDGSGGGNGCGGGILIETGATLSLGNVNLRQCSAASYTSFGGGIYVQAGAVLNVEGGSITENSAQGGNGENGTYGGDGGPGHNGYGGALYVLGTATVNRCTIGSNRAQGGNGGNGANASSEISPTPGGDGGPGGGALGAFAALAGNGLLQGDCVRMSGNSTVGGTGGDGGSGAKNLFGSWSSDGGAGGRGGHVCDSVRGIFVEEAATVRLAGYGGWTYTVGPGGAGGISPIDCTWPGSVGAAGPTGNYYPPALKCLDVCNYRSLDEAGTSSGFIGNITIKLLDINGVTLCTDISDSSSSFSHNAGLCHTYPTATVSVTGIPWGYRPGAKPPASFDRQTGISDPLTGSAMLYNIMYNCPIYVSPSGNDQYPFCSWSGAAMTLTEALDAAPAGSLILMKDAFYLLTNGIAVTNQITIRGNVDNPANVIVLQSALNVPCFRLSHPNALIEGLIIRGARSTGNGGGVVFDGGGSVNRCIITDNFAFNGGGIYAESVGGGTVSHTIIRANGADACGGGAVCTMGAILRNCLIEGNWSGGSGAGVFLDDGTVESCTLYGNVSGEAGGGIACGASGTVRNNVVWSNTAPVDPEWNVYGTVSASNCCTSPLWGTNSTTNEPSFVDADGGDFRLTSDSSGVDAGRWQSWMSGALDLRGFPRVVGPAPDMGAYECAQFTITATAVNGTIDPSGAVVCRELGDATFVFAPAGSYSALDVIVDGVSIGETNSYTFENVTSAHSITAAYHNFIHVSHDGTQVFPYADWATAARSLEQATQALSGASVILITNGTYTLTNEIRLASDVTVRGVQGAESTTLAGQGLVRLLYLDHARAIVEGVTITGGVLTNATLNNGAVYLNGGGTIRDCIVTGNEYMALFMHHGGYVRGCRFVDNFSGVYIDQGGRLEESVLTRHSAQALMISQLGTAANCAIVSNNATGATMLGGALSNCLIACNVDTQNVAGGVYASVGSSFDNCVIVSNTGPSVGGVAVSSGIRLSNCTIADNFGQQTGGGDVSGSLLLNCIVYGNRNSGMTAERNIRVSSPSSFTNCCTVPAQGANCVTASPGFADTGAGDYRLTLGSPCIDAGASANGVPPTDLLGVPRPLDGNHDSVAAVDIGAYEFVDPLADTDGDSVPDGWEIENDLGVTRHDDDEDADGDGMSNGDEYGADTLPQDRNSFLTITDIFRDGPGDIKIDWKGGVIATQVLECATNPSCAATMSWSPVRTNLPPTSTTNTAVIPAPTSRSAWYRIKASR